MISNCCLFFKNLASLYTGVMHFIYSCRYSTNSAEESSDKNKGAAIVIPFILSVRIKTMKSIAG